MPNIYNVKMQYLYVMGMIEEADGEIDENIEEALAQLTDNREELISSMLQEIKNEQGNQMLLKAEIERLRERSTSSESRQDKLKQAVIDTLKFFDMRSSSKTSNGYAFKNALFSCFTTTRKSYVLDEARLVEKFAPITGSTSKFVNYSVACKLDANSLKKVNDTGVVPATSYSVSVDKRAMNDYLDDIAVGKQLTFDDDSHITFDPIVDFATRVIKDSLTVK